LSWHHPTEREELVQLGTAEVWQCLVFQNESKINHSTKIFRTPKKCSLEQGNTCHVTGSRHPRHQGPITTHEKVLTGAGKVVFECQVGAVFFCSNKARPRLMMLLVSSAEWALLLSYSPWKFVFLISAVKSRNLRYLLLLH